MGWCEKCQVSFNEDVKLCPKCKGPLEPEGLAYRKLVKVIQVANNMEADLVVSVLSSCGIEAFKRYEKSGSYLNIYAGFNLQGVDIVVPKKDEEEASKIVGEIQLNNEEDLDADDIELKVGMERRSKHLKRILLIAAVLLPIISIIIFAISGSM